MSGPPPPEGTIDVEARADEHLRRTWRAQRIGWVAMAALVLAAFLGAFGDGPLAEARAGGGPGEALVHYDRFSRVDAEQVIALDVPPGLVHDRRLEVVLAGGFAEDYRLEHCSPAPSDQALVASGVVLGFRVDEAGAPVHLRLRVSATSSGSHTVGVGVGGAPAVALEQWVYP